jgi:hypothetical protein
MSFLYPNIISVSRPNQDNAVGAQPYSGILPANESAIITGLAAHIEADRQGTVPTAKLPGDAAGQSIWKIIFIGGRGLVQERDFITDEVGKRYQVISADWGPLSTTCRCQIMET